MGPASKRTKQAALIRLLVSHFYRQRCCQIIYVFFCCCCCFKKIPRPCRMERVLATWEGGGVGSGPSTHCGLTATLWTRSKMVLTSLQTGKIHLSALESMQTPRPQSSEPHPIHLPKKSAFKIAPMWYGEGNGNPLQYSCLENPRDGGAWRAAIYGVTQSRTRLKQLSSRSSQMRWAKERAPSTVSSEKESNIFQELLKRDSF